MQRKEIVEKINEIFSDVFEDDELVITDSTTSSDIDDWDSLSHLMLINEIETVFDIKFTIGEVQGSKNVGELIDSLQKHLEK